MEFAKYYNVTNKLNNMIRDGELFSYPENNYKGLFICKDTHDFWISRILEGYNEDFEQEEGKWLIERNKIGKYDLISFIEEKKNKKYNVDNRRKRDIVIDRFGTNETIEDYTRTLVALAMS